MKAVVGIDLGGTRVKAGLVAGGRLLGTHVASLAPADKTEAGILMRLVATARAVARDQGVAWKDVRGIGIGSPGALRRDTGVVSLSPNFPAWHEFALAERLSKKAGVPVALDNDANVITLGEAIYGAGRGVGDFVCLTLGSGVGTGIFLDGDVYRGADGMAGEVGHLTVEPEGYRCNCGNRGCLEQYSSANGLRNMVRRDRLFGDMTDAALADPHLPERLHDAAVAGDPRCQGYFDEFGYRLAIAISAVLHTLNVHTIVLAGGLARAMDAFGPSLFRELPTRGYPAILAPVRVVQCSLWEDAGVLGAAALAGGPRRRGS
jgi:glucokinase